MTAGRLILAKTPCSTCSPMTAKLGGLGLYLVLDMVDTLKYQRVDEENRVEVRVSMSVEDQSGDLSEVVSELPDAVGE